MQKAWPVYSPWATVSTRNERMQRSSVITPQEETNCATTCPSTAHMPWPASAAAPAAAYPSHMQYPPTVYQPPSAHSVQPQASPHVFQQPMSSSAPNYEHAYHHHMLIISAAPDLATDNPYEADEETSDNEADEATCQPQFKLYGQDRIQQLLLGMQNGDCDVNDVWPIPSCYDSATSDDDSVSTHTPDIEHSPLTVSFHEQYHTSSSDESPIGATSLHPDPTPATSDDSSLDTDDVINSWCSLSEHSGLDTVSDNEIIEMPDPPTAEAEVVGAPDP